MEDFGTPDEWEGTIGMTFGAVVVEMKTLVFEDDECTMLMSKLAEASHLERFASSLRDEGVAEFPVPARSSAGGGSMLSSREEEEKSLEFGFDSAENASEGKSSMSVFTEDYVLPTTEPSKSDRLSMTEGERKWYSSVWPFDLNFILSMGLTAVEKEWFTRLWNIDLNEEKGGGAVLRDKTLSGEYILNRPPKKPGGFQMFYVLLFFIWILVKGVEGNNIEEGVLYKSSEDDIKSLASSDEEVFNPLMALASFFFVVILVLLFVSWEDRKMKEIRQRRTAKTK